MDFTNKNVVITGGSTGIGYATAKAFIDNGAKVFITGRNEENLKKGCR
ncbi:SDR family NAD(P)-dependent oxidoreductase [Fulvivirga maritima]|nr:SDR family NAD(P)-dependent oxidoreductase [Fulvivirga maritima]